MIIIDSVGNCVGSAPCREGVAFLHEIEWKCLNFHWNILKLDERQNIVHIIAVQGCALIEDPVLATSEYGDLAMAQPSDWINSLQKVQPA